MDRGHSSAPVSGRTRLQMNRSSRKEYFQSSRRGAKHSSRTPEASTGPIFSEPKIDRNLTPNPNVVREVEFLLVARDGTVMKKFYFDEMKISLDSKDEGKETIDGTSSIQPIILSDDDDEEQVDPKDSSANRQESVPLKKRQKFDDQELPGLPMNSSLKGVDAQSCRDMKGDKLFKDTKGDKLSKDTKGDKLFKDTKGDDKLFKGMNSTALKPKEIQAKKPLGKNIKKEMMEGKSL